MSPLLPPKKLTAPCAVTSCSAMVEKAGQRCAVHKQWSQGPHAWACVRCRRAIEWGELYRLIDGDGTRPVHSQCVDHKVRFRKAAPKGWDANLGLFAKE